MSSSRSPELPLRLPATGRLPGSREPGRRYRLLLRPAGGRSSGCSSRCSFAGCMFDKVVRHFYDDACVVPEKAEGEFLSSSPPAQLSPGGVTKPARPASVCRRRHQARVRAVPRGPVLPAPRLAAALAVPGGSAGRPVQLPLHRVDGPRHGVQAHRAGRSEEKRLHTHSSHTPVIRRLKTTHVSCEEGITQEVKKNKNPWF